MLLCAVIIELFHGLGFTGLKDMDENGVRCDIILEGYSHVGHNEHKARIVEDML